MEFTRPVTGRSDYISGIDNEGIDFGQLDQFIHVTTEAESPTTTDNLNTNGSRNGSNNVGRNSTESNVSAAQSPTSALAINNVTTTATSQTHLPESPPDSGSEPPYSPADLQALTIVGPPTAIAPVHQRNVHHHPHHQHQQQQQQQQQHQTSHLSVANLSTFTDLSHTTIDLHHGHLSLLNTHHHQPDKQQQHQQHLHHYMRTDPSAQDQHLHQQHQQHQQHQHMIGVGEMTICKHENLLLQQHDPQLIIPQQNGNHLLDSYRSDLSHGSLLSIGPGQLTNDDLSRLMPSDAYSTATPMSTSTISIRTAHLASTLGASGTTVPSRKRKISQPDSDCTSLVKPEPSSSLSPMCQQQHMDQIDSPISSTQQNIALAPCTPETSNNGGNSNCVLDAVGQNPDTTGGGGSGSSTSGEPCPLQCIRFSPFQQQNWHVLCNQSLQELPLPYYNIDADKGFNFSNSDDAFVCQKKNHFQITCHAKLHGNAVFVRTSSGLEKIKSFHLHFYGVKLEAPNHTIRIEQSQSDRSKKPFHPVPIDLQSNVVSKITVVRLHFSETTSNNMRKKGRPNPEQRYFQLVVGLHAHTHSGHFPIVSYGSERIIVRASNPGQFESDVELCWQRGITQDSIFHSGRVGINTDRPDESLVVHGNLKISGHIVQPSDSRAKQEIGELDTSEQLKNLQKIRIVKYRYEPQFAIYSGLKEDNDNQEIYDTGVIAQEVRDVLPDAVQEAGNIVLSNGEVIEKFLLVNKDRILMENIGAVKELCKVTGSLETRIEQLEKINCRLIRIQQLDRNHNCSVPKCKHLLDDDDGSPEELCSNKTIQKIIIVLVIIMAICLLAISALYFVEHRQHYISTSTSGILSREQVYNSNNKRYHPSDRMHQHQQQKQQQQQDEAKERHMANNPSVSGDIPGNDILYDYPQTWKYQPSPPLSSPKPKDTKSLATTVITLNNIQSPDYDSDNVAAPPGDESSSEKIAETNISNLPPNSFEVDRGKKTVKGKSKANLLQSGSNTKKPQYGPESQYQQQEQLFQLTEQDRNNNNNNNNPHQQHIDGKGHPDAPEDQDLQYLSNNSDSDDQFPVENSVQLSNFVAINRTLSTLAIGVSSLCENVKAGTIECKSVCCEEESNRLLIPIDFIDLNPPNASNRTVGTTASENDSSLSNTSTSSLCSPPAGLQSNNNNNNVEPNLPLSTSLQEKLHQKNFEAQATNSKEGVFEVQQGSQQIKRKVDNSVVGKRNRSPVTGSGQEDLDLLAEHELNSHNITNSDANVLPTNRQTSNGGCFPILFFIRSESFNASAGREVLCLHGDRRHHIIYTIPVSKFMKETKIEFHFIGPDSLQWTLCNRKGRIATHGATGSPGDYLKKSPPSTSTSDNSNNIDDNGGILQLNPSKSIFHVYLPSFGYFEKQFELRAGYGFKSACQDHSDEPSNLLQYNIKIFRDCN